MGNTESSVESSLSRTSSIQKRTHSQSPTTNRNSSVNSRRIIPNQQQVMTDKPMRRSKTCRAKDRSTLRAICVITGLTLHQKALLTRKWNRMDRGTIYEIGRRMFDYVFSDSPHYLSYIDLRDEPNWRNHINFKIHVQRFVTALIESMRRLREPGSASDVLRDFGASYATYPKRVSAVYFERLANALNKAAAELQEGDHLSVEKTQSRIEDAESSLSSEGDKPTDANAAETQSLATSCSSMPTSRSVRLFEGFPRTLISRNSETQMLTLREECAENERLHDSGSCSHGDKSLCPITAEAWTVLSAYLANQIKFGYELEKLLQSEMSKLGLEKGLPGASRPPRPTTAQRTAQIV